MQAGWLREAVALCRERVETFDLAALSCEEISDPRVLAVQPLVSVVMITYNHAAYILQAVEGVLGQKTRFPFELIIAEDCSSDATRQIVLDVQRRHPDLVRVLVSGSNVGASVNMARAEQRCRGTYIAYCEGDDFWQRSDKLQRQADYLESHPGCAVVYSDCDEYYQATGQTLPSVVRASGPDASEHAARSGLEEPALFWFRTCTMFGRRSCIAEGLASNPLWMEKLPVGDTLRRLQFAAAGGIGFISESLGTYRVNAGGISRRGLITALRIYMANVRIRTGFYEASLLQGDGHVELGRVWPTLVQSCIFHHNPERARRLLALAAHVGVPPGTAARKLAWCRWRPAWALLRLAYLFWMLHRARTRGAAGFSLMPSM